MQTLPFFATFKSGNEDEEGRVGVAFFRLLVHERVEISVVKNYEGVGLSKGPKGQTDAFYGCENSRIRRGSFF